MTRVEWHGRSDFAEAAEALQIRTDQIMLQRSHRGMLTVVWTPADADPADKLAAVHMAALTRRPDGVLRIERGPVSAGVIADWLPPKGHPAQ